MKKTVNRFKSQLSGQIGENLVVAELGRRGFVATSFAGNVPDIDLVAYKDGRTLHLQVKSWRQGSFTVDASRFLDICQDGERQTVSGIVEGLDETLIYVLVRIGKEAGADEFFIMGQGALAAKVKIVYEKFLFKHNGIRPKNPATTHAAIGMEYLEGHRDDWGLIEDSLPKG